MRLASLAIILFLTSPAFAITKVKVPTLQQSEWADTEVMTNVAINLSNSRTFSWRLEMDASPSNNVLIALGKDTNGDGELTPSEWETTLGWDCGAWFIRYEPTGWMRTIAVASGHHALDCSLRVNKNDQPSTFTFTENGRNLLELTAADLPVELFDRTWNRLAVIRRGLDYTNERATLRIEPNGFIFRLQ
jgi:hypothetical protein